MRHPLIYSFAHHPTEQSLVSSQAPPPWLLILPRIWTGVGKTGLVSKDESSWELENSNTPTSPSLLWASFKERKAGASGQCWNLAVQHNHLGELKKNNNPYLPSLTIN